VGLLTNQPDKDQIVAKEIFRMLDAARNTSPDALLPELLAGYPCDVEHVKKIFLFAKKYFSPGTVQTSILVACLLYLEKNVPFEELQEIKNPWPIAGEPGFQSVLDEIAETDPGVRETINEILNGSQGKKS
jgi:hypothetical protein